MKLLLHSEKHLEMSKNVIHNFNLSIQNSADINSAEHLTETIIKELAKVSKEMSQHKDIVQEWQEQKNQNTTTITDNSYTSTGEGATSTTVETSEKSIISVSTTSSVSEGTTTNSTISIGGDTIGAKESISTIPSMYDKTTLSSNVPIGEGVADTFDRPVLNFVTSVNTTSPVSETESDTLNLNNGITSQIYAGVAAQQILAVPQMIQTNSSEPTIEVIKAEIKKKIEVAHAANDFVAVEYWKKISKAFEEGFTAKDFDGKPTDMLFTEMYALLKKSNQGVITIQNFNWHIVREKIIKAIDVNILQGKISKENKVRWETIKEQLKKDTTNIANLFERYNELFLLLREVEGLDVLPGTITITTKTKIYPNLSADRLYAEIGKEAVYVFLKEINDEDVPGSAVYKNAVKIKNTNATSFIVGESLEFFLDETLIVENSYKKEDINWIVYKKRKGKKDEETIFKDEGTSFSYNFDTEGAYTIEAYGYKHGANSKKNRNLFSFGDVKIVAQEIVITPPASIKDRFIRPIVDTQLFKVSLLNKEIKTLNPLKFYYQVETKNANTGIKISDLQELDSTAEIKLSMPDLAEYKIMVFTKDQYGLSKEFVVKTIKNYVSSIVATNEDDTKAADIYLLNQISKKIIFKANSFKIEPATQLERKNVKWLVYDQNNKIYIPDGLTIQNENDDVKKTYLNKGESFAFTVPKIEGDFTIEAYSNSKEGIKSLSSRKITVKVPKVKEAYWAYSNGDKKKVSGFSGEVNYVRAAILDYNSQEVRINVFLNDSNIASFYSDTKTNSRGEINQAFNFNLGLQKYLGIKTGKTAKIRFELQEIQNGEVFSFKKNAGVYYDTILDVTTAVKITDLYFEYENKRVNQLTPVPFGAKVKGVVKTLNKVDQEVVLKIYKNATDIKHTAKVKVNKEGGAIIDFTLNEEWNTINPLTGMMDMFYLGIEGIESKFSLENGLNAVVVSNIIDKNEGDKYGIDIPYFLAEYKGKNEENLKVLLNDMNEYYTSEKVIPRKEHVAYMLATVYTETFKTFRPIVESFWITDKEVRERSYHRYDPILADTDKRRATAIKRGNTKRGDGVRYCGRGYVQLTWKNNYKKIKEQFGIDVVEYPDKVLEPKLAAKIMIWGMNNGIFTDVSINKYINDSKTDYVNARKVINGTDLEKEIAGDAEKFEKSIKIIKSKDATKSKFLEDALEEMKIIADKHLPYAQEGNIGGSKGLRTGLNDNALEKMDCSEFVCRYLYKLGITDEVKWVTTASMTSESLFQKALGTDKIKFAGKSKDFKPQAGDIFVWRDGANGHTGIVYKYDSTADLVTILEAIGKSGSRDDSTNKKNGGYILTDCTRTSIYKLKGKALFAHPGFIGYFRPQKT